MPKGKRIGFFGGSFDPPHLGHLLAAVAALRTFQLDEVWLAPVWRHRFRKETAPFADRVKMCRLLLQGLSPRLRVSTFEGDRKSSGRTLETLRALRKKHPAHRFSLVIGSDLLRETKRWYRFREIEKRFGVLVIRRGKGIAGEPAIPDVSSREIRRRLKDRRTLGALLTPAVAEYIFGKGLYRTRSIQPPPRSSSPR